MKLVDEFRDADLVRAASAEIRRLVDELPARRSRIMEVCGGHTHAIYRFGLDQLLPEEVEMVHGPGCPVCVLPSERIDEVLALGDEHPDLLLTAFGDLMRVPASDGRSLAELGRERFRMVYSPLDALELARRNPERRVVFFRDRF